MYIYNCLCFGTISVDVLPAEPKEHKNDNFTDFDPNISVGVAKPNPQHILYYKHQQIVGVVLKNVLIVWSHAAQWNSW